MYGITSNQYDALLVAQAGLCAICKRPEKARSKKFLAVDHDHNTGEIRGLLCHKCNAGLGHFDEDSDLLADALAYLLSSR